MTEANCAAVDAEMFPDRSVFLAPDSGARKTPYACSFHWIKTGEGRVVGLDLVRSDDMDRRALRVFDISPDGAIKSLILEAPSSQWAPFATGAPPALNQAQPVLGRGANWVAGSATSPSQPIASVSFEFRLNPVDPGKGTGECGLLLAHLNAMDYPRTETSGWIELNGERIEFERSLGPASIHFGDFLPDYAWAATVAGTDTGTSGLLVNALNSDDLRSGSLLINDKSVVYGFGSGNLPGLWVTIGHLEKRIIPLGLRARLELSQLQTLPHTLLERPTVTAAGEATYVADHLLRTEALSVGRVVLDFRGQEYAPLLGP